MINDFLKSHRVDVGRSLAVLGIVGAVGDTMEMIIQPAFMGTFTLNFGPPIMVWLSCALWMRRPWVRKLLIGFGWLAAFCVAGATIKVVFFGGMALTFNGTSIAKPTLGQYLSLFIVSTPLVYVLLRIFHSEKFREEIYSAEQEPIQPPVPMRGNGT